MPKIKEFCLFFNSSILILDELVKSHNPVTPANAGVQKLLKWLDSGFRRNDKKLIF